MTDKYEEAVLDFMHEYWPMRTKPTREMMRDDCITRPMLIQFACWYEEHYLADALTAATMMRDKETCETCREERHCSILGTAMQSFGVEKRKTFRCALYFKKVPE